jgi:outer membrane protein
MKRVQVFAGCLFILALFAVPCRAFAFVGVEAAVGYWSQTPSGSFSYKKISATDDLDLQKDLNLGKENRPFARVKVELPLLLPNIYFVATPMSFEGTGRKDVQFNFGGQQFDASVPIDSKVKLDHYDLAFYYPIPFLKTASLGKFNLDLGINVRLINFEGTITNPAKSSSKSLGLYAPMLYAGIQFKPVSLFSIEAELRGITYGSSHYTDYLGRLKVMPWGPLFAAAGYRSEDLTVNQGGVTIKDIKFSGPFVEAGFSF